MAKNPTWESDEVILALDLYLRFGRLDPRHPEVIALSELLNRLPIHAPEVREANFRNPAGVALKIENLRALDPAKATDGAGMPRGGRNDRLVWEQYGTRPEELSGLAVAIRAGVTGLEPQPLEEDEGFLEGRVLERLHKRRERNRALIDKKLRLMRKQGEPLACEACGFDFGAAYGSLGQGFIEFHHRRPLSETGMVKTRPEDLAPMCANCHRMIHRSKPLMSVAELQELIQKE